MNEQNSSKYRHTVCDVFSRHSAHCAACSEGVRRQGDNGKTTGFVVQRLSGVFRLLSDVESEQGDDIEGSFSWEESDPESN